MLRPAYLKENREEALERLAKRGQGFQEDLDKVISLDEERRKVQAELNQKQAEMKEHSERVGELFKAGKKEEAEEEKGKSGELKKRIAELNEAFNEKEEELAQLLYHIPNIPHPKVPAGDTDADNELIEQEGDTEGKGKEELPHWELANTLGIIDLDAGVKVTGSGFPVYRKKGAKLQRAMISWFLDRAEESGYEEVMPPLLVNEASGKGTGQLPDKEGQMYKVEDHDLYLIPTAEVPITNLYRDRILEEKELPQRLVGYTPCFRREAGSYGKDVRGLNRLHQFEKVEVVHIEDPERSYEALWEMVDHVKSLLRDLELPFRVMRLCGGDLGQAAAMTYDLEVYSRAQQKWLEVSSVSNFEDYQSNRLKLRVKDGKKKVTPHTLNGSALALARVLAALLENNQDGERIIVPEVLRPYTGFETIEKPSQ